MADPGAVDRLADDRDYKTLRRRSVHGTGITFAAQGARFVVQFGSQIMLANLLAPADFGLVAMVTPLLYLVQIFNELGLMQATVQQEEITEQQLTALFWINMLVSISLAAVMMAAAPLVAWIYGEPRLTMVTIGLAAVIVFSGLSAQHMALLTRRMRFFALSFIDITCITVAGVAGLTAARLGAAYWSLVIMQAANMATIAALGWTFSRFRPGLPRRGVRVGSLLRVGANVAGHNIVTFAGYNLPSVMIGLCFNATLLGLYDRSFRLVVVPLWQLNAPLDRIGTALLSRLRTSDEQFRRAYCLMLQFLMVLTVPGFIWAASMAGILVPTMLGPAWVGAVPVVTWLAISAIPAPITMSTYWVFVSQGRSQEQLRNSLVRNGLVVVSLFAGLAWGPVGVAVSAACFAPVIHAVSIFGITRRGAITMGVMARALYPIAIGGAAAGLALSLIIGGGVGEHWSAATKCLAALPLSYLVFGVVMLCTPAGPAMLRDAMKIRSAVRGTPARDAELPTQA